MRHPFPFPRLIVTVLLICSCCSATGQDAFNDWDTYVTSLNGRTPVSVMVNLALVQKNAQRSRPFAIILRTKVHFPDAQGQPGQEEMIELDSMENHLEHGLRDHIGAVYAGRFTQRGLREFYFYGLDTMDYLRPVREAMAQHPGYDWLCQAKYDKDWTNYQQVLYPSPRDLERIQDRRLVDQLVRKGDPLKVARPVDHYFYFKTKSERESFLRDPLLSGFHILEMPDEPSKGDLPFLLHVNRKDVPDYKFIDKVVLPLGRYPEKGWPIRWLGDRCFVTDRFPALSDIFPYLRVRHGSLTPT